MGKVFMSPSGGGGTADKLSVQATISVANWIETGTEPNKRYMYRVNDARIKSDMSFEMFLLRTGASLYKKQYDSYALLCNSLASVGDGNVTFSNVLQKPSVNINILLTERG